MKPEAERQGRGQGMINRFQYLMMGFIDRRESSIGGASFQSTASTMAALHKPQHPSTCHPVTVGLGLGLALPPPRPPP